MARLFVEQFTPTVENHLDDDSLMANILAGFIQQAYQVDVSDPKAVRKFLKQVAADVEKVGDKPKRRSRTTQKSWLPVWIWLRTYAWSSPDHPYHSPQLAELWRNYEQNLRKVENAQQLGELWHHVRWDEVKQGLAAYNCDPQQDKGQTLLTWVYLTPGGKQFSQRHAEHFAKIVQVTDTRTFTADRPADVLSRVTSAPDWAAINESKTIGAGVTSSGALTGATTTTTTSAESANFNSGEPILQMLETLARAQQEKRLMGLSQELPVALRAPGVASNIPLVAATTAAVPGVNVPLVPLVPPVPTADRHQRRCVLPLGDTATITAVTEYDKDVDVDEDDEEAAKKAILGEFADEPLLQFLWEAGSSRYQPDVTSAAQVKQQREADERALVRVERTESKYRHQQQPRRHCYSHDDYHSHTRSASNRDRDSDHKPSRKSHHRSHSHKPSSSSSHHRKNSLSRRPTADPLSSLGSLFGFPTTSTIDKEGDYRRDTRHHRHGERDDSHSHARRRHDRHHHKSKHHRSRSRSSSRRRRDKHSATKNESRPVKKAQQQEQQGQGPLAALGLDKIFSAITKASNPYDTLKRHLGETGRAGRDQPHVSRELYTRIRSEAKVHLHPRKKTAANGGTGTTGEDVDDETTGGETGDWEDDSAAQENWRQFEEPERDEWTVAPDRWRTIVSEGRAPITEEEKAQAYRVRQLTVAVQHYLNQLRRFTTFIVMWLTELRLPFEAESAQLEQAYALANTQIEATRQTLYTTGDFETAERDLDRVLRGLVQVVPEVANRAFTLRNQWKESQRRQQDTTATAGTKDPVYLYRYPQPEPLLIRIDNLSPAERARELRSAIGWQQRTADRTSYILDIVQGYSTRLGRKDLSVDWQRAKRLLEELPQQISRQVQAVRDQDWYRAAELIRTSVSDLQRMNRLLEEEANQLATQLGATEYGNLDYNERASSAGRYHGGVGESASASSPREGQVNLLSLSTLGSIFATNRPGAPESSNILFREIDRLLQDPSGTTALQGRQESAGCLDGVKDTEFQRQQDAAYRLLLASVETPAAGGGELIR